jgi:hypothetical protein
MGTGMSLSKSNHALDELVDALSTNRVNQVLGVRGCPKWKIYHGGGQTTNGNVMQQMVTCDVSPKGMNMADWQAWG